MSIQKFTVSNDPNLYEAWPDVVKTKSGRLICVFTECQHHLDRNDSRIMLCSSDDRGRTWTKKIPLTEKSFPYNRYNNARISQFDAEHLVIVCDRLTCDKNDTILSEDKGSEMLLWFGDAEGTHWTEPRVLPFCAIVPDKIQRLKCGRLLLGGHYKNEETDKLTQYLWYSDDNGVTWSERVTVASDPRYNLCEVSFLELSDETLVAFMRENSGLGIDCLKVISADHGETWSEVSAMAIPACHRPVSGFLNDGTIMLTYRFLQNFGGGIFGGGNQNLFAAFFDEASAKCPDRTLQRVRIMPIDYDRHPESDQGYSGWVQYDDGEIYVVNYLKDDAEKAQIRGYSFLQDDVILPNMERKFSK